MKKLLHSFLTARDTGARLTAQTPLELAATLGTDEGLSTPGLPRVFVDSTRRFQTLEGFGGAFTESAAVTWRALAPPQRDRFLSDHFDPQEGQGYLLCRLHMNSCDFSLGNYAHVEAPGDIELSSFSIERDRACLLPMVKAAQAVAAGRGRELKLLASPWSPPAWMKSNGAMNGGGRLLPEYRAAWARCYVRFIEAYAAEGVPIWGITVQNEPEAAQRWDSCLWTAAEERDFVRDHLGPTLHAAGLGHVRIIVWDHNRDQMVERASTVYADPLAKDYVWGCGFHWYGDDCFDNVRLLHDAWPDKGLLFTEGCQEGGPHRGSWLLGERYARSIINDLNRWTSGWIDWNLLLDAEGGPNHVGNFCSAPVLAVDGELERQSSFYYLGHFARFIAPGAQRVLCAATRDELETTAFINPDGGLAIVVLNRTEKALRFAMAIDGCQALATLPARSIATWLTLPSAPDCSST
jgi:glucosylceramidase